MKLTFLYNMAKCKHVSSENDVFINEKPKPEVKYVNGNEIKTKPKNNESVEFNRCATK